MHESGKWRAEDGLEPLASLEEFAHLSTARVPSDPNSRHPFRDNPDRLAEAKWRVPVLNRESRQSTSTAFEATPEWSEKGWNMVKYTSIYAKHVHDIWSVISDVPLTPEEQINLSQFSATERPLEEARLKMLKNTEFHKSPEHTTYQALMDAFVERTPFLSTGGYVGIGPREMLPGDLLCVIFGGSYPFVLRQKEIAGLYSLVGEAYCDGMMYGEALEMGLPVQDFVLA
jgi:hypothetical protein